MLTFVSFAPAQKPMPINQPNKVDGLELPETILVSTNNDFTRVVAKTNGSVKWLVISDPKIQYLEEKDGKAIILGTLPPETQVTIFAIANINGKLTDFACTKTGAKKEQSKKEENKEEKLNYKIHW
jgi:hypothetical protein